MHARGEVPPPQDAPTYDLPDDFWDQAKVVLPPKKTPVSIRVDDDVLTWFKDQGPGHLTRMQAVLRAYFVAQKQREKDEV